MFTPCKTRNPEVIFTLAAKKSGLKANREHFTKKFDTFDLEKQGKVLNYLRQVINGGISLTQEVCDRLTV
jgi:hypothetical protein